MVPLFDEPPMHEFRQRLWLSPVEIPPREEHLLQACAFCLAALKPEHHVSMQGVSYTSKMKTGWKLPGKLRVLSEEEKQALRDKFHILVEGSELPTAVTRFEDLKLPGCILDTLKSKGINKPTPIQMQVPGLKLRVLWSVQRGGGGGLHILDRMVTGAHLLNGQAE
jgi:hypothetical protein